MNTISVKTPEGFSRLSNIPSRAAKSLTCLYGVYCMPPPSPPHITPPFHKMPLTSLDSVITLPLPSSHVHTNTEQTNKAIASSASLGAIKIWLICTVLCRSASLFLADVAWFSGFSLLSNCFSASSLVLQSAGLLPAPPTSWTSRSLCSRRWRPRLIRRRGRHSTSTWTTR